MTPHPPTEFNLDALMSDLRLYVKSELQKCGKTHIEADTYPYQEGETCSLQADREGIRQILVHLLDNAVKYIESGFISFGYLAPDTLGVDFFVADTREDEDFNKNLTVASGLAEEMGSALKVSQDVEKPAEYGFYVKGLTKMTHSQLQ